MRTIEWKNWGAGLAVVAIMASGCGGGGGGGAATGGTSTVSGNVSNQSVALQQGASRSLFARVVRWLSPVTDAFAGRNGIRVVISNLEATTDSTGSFAISGALPGPLTVTFSNGSQTFTFQVTVPPGATVVLRDVELDSDGSALPGEIDTYVRGTVASASCSTTPQTLTVAVGNQSLTFDLNAQTIIKGTGEMSASTCQDLANATGQPVKVDAVTQSDGSLLAERVKLHDNSENPENEIGLRGAVSSTSCPSSITIARPDGESVIVNLTSSTALEGVSSCDQLANQHVKVKGTLETDGSVTASEVEIEDDEERGDEGRRDFIGDHQPGTPTPSPTASQTPTASPTPTATPA